jgi:hypothetical protein
LKDKPEARSQKPEEKAKPENESQKPEERSKTKSKQLSGMDPGVRLGFLALAFDFSSGF